MSLPLSTKAKVFCYKMRNILARYALKLLREKRTANWHVYYFGGPNFDAPNFGDQLNIDLMNYLGCHYTACNVHDKESKKYLPAMDLMCIGSLLERALKDKYRLDPLWIFGNGFISEPKGEEVNRSGPIRVCALRGRLSQARMEKVLGRSMQGIPLGDPGLLIRRIFPDVSREKQYDVGIITHYADAEVPVLEKIHLKNLTYKLINIEQATANFVAEVAQCRFILSSAMHGLICADSLGIPNRHILLSSNLIGVDYKFRDYYSAYENVPYRFVDLREQIIKDEDVLRYTEEYCVQQEEVERICDRLEAAFPRWR